MGEQKDGIFAATNPKRPVRLGVRTADFHSVNRGSIPLRATKKNPQRKLRVFLFECEYVFDKALPLCY